MKKQFNEINEKIWKVYKKWVKVLKVADSTGKNMLDNFFKYTIEDNSSNRWEKDNRDNIILQQDNSYNHWYMDNSGNKWTQIDNFNKWTMKREWMNYNSYRLRVKT